MSLVPKNYDLSTVQLVVGGVLVSGYAEDGGIEFENAAPIAEVTTGADGLTVRSRTSNDDLVCRITVSEASRAYNLLAGLMQVQAAAPVLTPLPFLLVDPQNGDTVSAPYAIFTERPVPSKGSRVGDRTFVLHLPGAAGTAVFGALNVV